MKDCVSVLNMNFIKEAVILKQLEENSKVKIKKIVQNLGTILCGGLTRIQRTGHLSVTDMLRLIPQETSEII